MSNLNSLLWSFFSFSLNQILKCGSLSWTSFKQNPKCLKNYSIALDYFDIIKSYSTVFKIDDLPVYPRSLLILLWFLMKLIQLAKID